MMNHTAGDPLLQVSHLSVMYRHKEKKILAVDDVSFDIFQGETLGLVGESGCGKSTIARAISFLVKKTEGTIKFKGALLPCKSAKKNIQLVFQDTASSLNPRMTIEEILTEPLIIHSPIQSRSFFQSSVVEAMQLVGLSHHLLSHYPHELSGGQKGRVCIARAIILKPDLIIFDESVASLDISIQAQIINLLMDLREHFGLTYLFISHDLSLVRFLSSRIAVMHEGKIVEIGDADQIYDHPQHPYTQKLTESLLLPLTHN